ncbi:hypothetical protein NC99_10350 [Sunxiuqinia dokdonensis]|uniref:Uncharacterized protein n=1 Tax=Sunxiuqinia dokdonensis TaxID=1409788 RepID=A0A0L8VDE6_9BACT|nr:hypothetical protein NC99_10350 [Sunxiuqinia dokdonensis]
MLTEQFFSLRNDGGASFDCFFFSLGQFAEVQKTINHFKMKRKPWGY